MPLLRLSLLTWLALLGLFATPARASREYVSDSGEIRRFLFFTVQPARDNPSDQLRHARELREAGKRKPALRELERLVLKWPGAPEAPEAQWQRATLLEEMGRLQEAFDAFQELLTRYPGEAPYTRALESQVRIAETIEKRRKATFWFFKGFTTPEQAIPYYESIVASAPSWERAPELLYRVAQIRRGTWESEECLPVFNRVIAEYPQSPYAEKAAFARAEVTYADTLNHPNHEERARSAWADVTLYLTRFTDRQHTEEAMRMQAELRARLARFAYDRAVFYDRIARRPAAAITAYEAFVRDFPISEWTETARARIAELRSSAPSPTSP
jgi:outer membrane protein assembly factor BamD (BamD/ComL family)